MLGGTLVTEEKPMKMFLLFVLTVAVLAGLLGVLASVVQVRRLGKRRSRL
jgi:hypothetical protein